MTSASAASTRLATAALFVGRVREAAVVIATTSKTAAAAAVACRATRFTTAPKKQVLRAHHVDTRHTGNW